VSSERDCGWRCSSACDFMRRTWVKLSVVPKITSSGNSILSSALVFV